jgi:hypothetical protein
MTILEIVLRVCTWAGFCWLFIAWTNPLHGRKHSLLYLTRLRYIHDLAILCSPWLLFRPGSVTHDLTLLFDLNAYHNDRLITLFMTLASLFGLVGLARQVFIYRMQLWHAPVKTISKLIQYYPPAIYQHQPVRKSPLLYIPGNQVWSVEYNSKEVLLDPRCRAYAGLSILHLSDLHLIGFLNQQFYCEMMQEALKLQPSGRPYDLVIFTGDLLDQPDMLDWIEPVFSQIPPELPRYYILGNHDWTKCDPALIRRELDRLGWIDISSIMVTVETRLGPVELAGTEVPWMGSSPPLSEQHAGALRILASHSPDQIMFAAYHNVDLVLAGHTHGGQVVIPFFGPMYSPSIYGPRYAGGTFKERQTVMHVSRGISGEHPLRWNCRPEVSRLVLGIQEA